MRGAALWLLTLTTVPALAGVPDGVAAGEPRGRGVITVTAGRQYDAGPIKRILLGAGYRHLWVAPLEVEVLELDTFGDGLRAVKRGGGKRTRSLHFEGGDGRRYRVRSVDKDPSRAIPKAARPLVDALAEDTTSALMPAGALVVSRLLEAAGVLHVKPRLVVLPDDDRLGEFREEFAGMLGQLEEVPRPGRSPGFSQAIEIVDWEDLEPRFYGSARDRVDAEAFLRARLVDLLVGDWDRHDLQWEWARVEGGTEWQPITMDRDQAFSRFDGLLVDVARLRQPRLVEFGPKYPDMTGLTWNARLVDRRFLAGLEWSTWQRVARELRRRLTDRVLRDAVGELPAAWASLEADRLTRALQRRRDLLPAAARRHYLLLAREVDVEATDADDRGEVVRAADGTLRVRLFGAGSEVPYLDRSFDPAETEEVRILLRGGDDRLVVRGAKGTDGIRLHLAGGSGDDVLDDSAGGGTRLYDSDDGSRIVPGPGTRFDDRVYEHPRDHNENPLRDWGRAVMPAAWLDASPESGLLVGGGVEITRYGFRRHPFASRHTLRVARATGAGAFVVDYHGELRRLNSRRHAHLVARLQGFDIVRFHGVGNETASPDGKRFELDQRQLLLSARVSLPLPEGEISVGPLLKFHETPLRPGAFISETRPYGVGDFGQMGVRGSFLLDTRKGGGHPRRGLRIEASVSTYPRWWDVTNVFGRAQIQAAGYHRLPLPLRPTLALRGGGRRAWGRYPLHEAAFVGAGEVRSLRPHRYAGDAAVFGTAELRLKLGVAAVFGLADAGRVFVQGERSRRWHAAVGGGLRLATPGGDDALAITAAHGGGTWRIHVASTGSF